MSKSSPTPHMAVLNHDDAYTAIQINPAALKASVTLKTSFAKTDALLAFNANYSWLGKPIGRLFHGPTKLASISKYDEVRPMLSIAKGKARIESGLLTPPLMDVEAIIQAGPWLVFKGEVQKQPATAKREFFRDDAIREAAHVAVGVTKAGKVVVIYAKATMTGLAALLVKHGVEYGMKVDGGHAAGLSWRDGEGQRHTLGNTGKIAVGLSFNLR